MTLFMDNADRGANHANDELIAALLQRARQIQALADLPGAPISSPDFGCVAGCPQDGRPKSLPKETSGQ